MLRLSRLATLLAATSLLLAVGCTRVEAPPPPPPPEVFVEVPVQRDVTNYGEFTGNLRAVASVEIRARVQGFLEQINFQPSSVVHRGDLLFVIEQEPYEATLERARADVQASEAAVRRAESDLERLELAVKTNAVSQQEVTRARAERDQARAAELGAASALTQATLNLDYTTIESPISGLISRHLVDAGNIVGRGDTTLLANVYRVNPIHVYFEVPEVLIAQFLNREGGMPSEIKNDAVVPVFVRVDGVDREFEGVLDYVDPNTDATTGTTEVRAELPNPDGRLLPGFFVRIKVPGELEPGALLVRETALSADLGGRYLMVIGENNVVDKRYVETGALEDDGLRVIREGIAAGEQYITRGLQRARPGLPVNPKPAGGAS